MNYIYFVPSRFTCRLTKICCKCVTPHWRHQLNKRLYSLPNVLQSRLELLKDFEGFCSRICTTLQCVLIWRSFLFRFYLQFDLNISFCNLTPSRRQYQLNKYSYSLQLNVSQWLANNFRSLVLQSDLHDRHHNHATVSHLRHELHEDFSVTSVSHPQKPSELWVFEGLCRW